MLELAQHRGNRPLRKFDLERVERKRHGVRQFRIGRRKEPDLARGLADQSGFGLRRPPRFMRDTAERKPQIGDATVLHLERSSNGDQRESITRPVADLAIGRVACQRQWRQLDRGDQFAGPEFVSMSGRSPGRR